MGQLSQSVGQAGQSWLQSLSDDADVRAKASGMEATAAQEAAQAHREAAQRAEKHADRALDALKQINQARRDAERAANRV